MRDYTGLTTKVKRQITRFCNKISGGFSKPAQRFIRESIYGIQASKDIKFSNIARTLNEEIDLIKTETRLSRNAQRKGMDEALNEILIKEASRFIHKDTVLAVDISDISKPHAKEMENLAMVKDGSDEDGKINPGYNLIKVLGAEVTGENIIPLSNRLYSTVADDFVSENREILNSIDQVAAHTKTRGIFTIDRGGDREKLLKPIVNKGFSFVIRGMGTRNIKLMNGREKNMMEAAKSCKTIHRWPLRYQKDGKTIEKTLRVGFRKIGLTFVDCVLTMVVIKGYGQKPMILLTNLEVNKTKQSLKRILDIYLTRWKCEESFRFLKQCYNLEDIRTQKYQSLKNMVTLVQCVFYFISVILGRRTKLKIMLTKICEKARRFFEIPAYKQYAIADGLFSILFPSKKGIPEPRAPDPSPQMALPLQDL